MLKTIPLVMTLFVAGQIANQAAAEPMEIRCGNTDVSIPERIAGCTAIIDGGRNLGRELSQAYAQRGLAYTQTRDLARAGQDVEMAVQIVPSNVTAWTTRANYFYVINKADLAMKAANKAVELDPELPLTYFVRAAAATKLQNYDLAIADLRRAAALDPSLSQARDALQRLGETR